MLYGKGLILKGLSRFASHLLYHRLEARSFNTICFVWSTSSAKRTRLLKIRIFEFILWGLWTKPEASPDGINARPDRLILHLHRRLILSNMHDYDLKKNPFFFFVFYLSVLLETVRVMCSQMKEWHPLLSYPGTSRLMWGKQLWKTFVGRGRNAVNHHFFTLSQMFTHIQW